MNVVVLALVVAVSVVSAKPAAPEAGKASPPPAAAKAGPGELDAPRKIAESYLKALEGKGDGTARNYLLGGATLTANDFTIPNWKIVKRDEVRTETKDVDGAVKMMRDLEKKGAEALNSVVVSEDAQVALSQEQANKLLEPTRQQAQRFIEAYPLFSYVARVGKDVFWHPENPWLKEVKRLDKGSQYTLEVHRFQIEEKDGGNARIWPLRVLRVTSKSYDSGWKILPASDWDPNY
ncbi:MAG TPA: hypothetical protein VGF99_05215 [Myxococcota bacterium]